VPLRAPPPGRRPRAKQPTGDRPQRVTRLHPIARTGHRTIAGGHGRRAGLRRGLRNPHARRGRGRPPAPGRDDQRSPGRRGRRWRACRRPLVGLRPTGVVSRLALLVAGRGTSRLVCGRRLAHRRRCRHWRRDRRRPGERHRFRRARCLHGRRRNRRRSWRSGGPFGGRRSRLGKRRCARIYLDVGVAGRLDLDRRAAPVVVLVAAFGAGRRDLQLETVVAARVKIGFQPRGFCPRVATAFVLLRHRRRWRRRRRKGQHAGGQRRLPAQRQQSLTAQRPRQPLGPTARTLGMKRKPSVRRRRTSQMAAQRHDPSPLHAR
jgi:hypothetical protein